MHRSWSLSLGLLLVGSVLGVSSSAGAQVRSDGLATANKLSLGASIGYAFRVTDEGDLEDDANPYGLGLGLRAGYTLNGGLYLGGLFNYFLGESFDNALASGRANQMNLAGDVGYDIRIGGNAVLRPVLGVGATVALGEVCVLDRCENSESDLLLLLAPGVNLVVAIGELYVGGEARYYYMPDDNLPDGLYFGGNIGALL